VRSCHRCAHPPRTSAPYGRCNPLDGGEVSGELGEVLYCRVSSSSAWAVSLRFPRVYQSTGAPCCIKTFQLFSFPPAPVESSRAWPPTGRERIASPTLQTLQGPVWGPRWVCLRGGGRGGRVSRPHLRARAEVARVAAVSPRRVVAVDAHHRVVRIDDITRT
jgi:hypothetical protein